MTLQEELPLYEPKIDILLYLAKKTVTNSHNFLNQIFYFIVNKSLMKLGERLSENWEKFGDSKEDAKTKMNLDAIKKIFLSQRFITMFLRSLRIFEDWALKSLERLLYVLEMKTFSKGERVFTQGEEATGFYIIFKGDVLITHKINARYRQKLEVQK